uniref:Uncharacterized protein n=1 Tax=Globodera rostochiensis TaxID=31243 RepID=A0A914HEQ2_GLORO
MAASFILLFWAVLIINCSSLAEDPLDLEKHLCAKAGLHPADGFKMITTDLIQIEPFKLANANTIHGLLLKPQEDKVGVTVVDSKHCMIETIFIETLKCNKEEAAKTSQIQHPECDDTASHCTPLRYTVPTG